MSIQPPRHYHHPGRLTEEERKIISKYSSKKAMQVFKISADTYYSIISPHGTISERTLEKLRSSISDYIKINT